MRIASATLFLGLTATGFAREPGPSPLQVDQVMSAQSAVELLRQDGNAKRGISGTFEFEVRSTGGDINTYLNSHEDYRDRNNLAVRMSPDVSQALKRQWGALPRDFLNGKRIAVEGTIFFHKLPYAVSGPSRSVRRAAQPLRPDGSSASPALPVMVTYGVHAWIEIQDLSKIRILE